MFRTIDWTEAGVVMLDQRRLPAEEVYLTLTTAEEVAEAIRAMAIRGAPAIGVAAAMGIALGFAARAPLDGGAVSPGRAAAPGGAAGDDPAARFERLAALLGATRPTAVNLFWAIDRMRGRLARESHRPLPAIAAALRDEALAIRREDLEANRAMGRLGAELLPDNCRVLTHCNAGALATAGYGTALGVVRAAVERGKKVAVFAGETRPFLQGARLTAWELQRDGIPVTLLTDGMTGHLFQKKAVDVCLVGADRIARNGDVANKIGTYPVAVLAQAHGVPFFVAAPTSTVDLSLPDGSAIPIEERSEDEVTHLAGSPIAPAGVGAIHPAFDVTPARLIAAIITERGIARPPYDLSLSALCGAAGGRVSPRPAGAP